MMMRRTIVRGALLSAGLAAAIAIAACGPQTTAASTGRVPTFTSAAAGASGADLSGGLSASASPTNPAPPVPAAPAVNPPPAAPAPGLTPECRAAGLRVWIGRGSAGAGHVYQPLEFTNTGGRACVIVGFPGVSYVGGGNGRQVGAPAQRDGGIGGQITLAPGATASAVVTRVDTGVFDPGSCRPTPVDGLRVYPPDETASVYVPLGVTGCAGNPPSPQLMVRTMKSGVGGN